MSMKFLHIQRWDPSIFELQFRVPGQKSLRILYFSHTEETRHLCSQLFVEFLPQSFKFSESEDVSCLK